MWGVGIRSGGESGGSGRSERGWGGARMIRGGWGGSGWGGGER